MVQSNIPGTDGLGTFDARAGKGHHRSPVKVEAELGVPRKDPETGEWTVELELTTLYPARKDETMVLELPEYKAELLRDKLDQQLERMD